MLFSSREHKFVYLFLFALFVGLDTSHHKYLIINKLRLIKKAEKGVIIREKGVIIREKGRNYP